MKKTLYSLDARGRITCEPGLPDKPLALYVYQRVAKGLGNIPESRHKDLQVRAHVIPFDPKTPSQITNRDRFRQAILEWRLLSPEEKKEWTKKGKSRRLPGYQAFLSNTMKYWHLSRRV